MGTPMDMSVQQRDRIYTRERYKQRYMAARARQGTSTEGKCTQRFDSARAGHGTCAEKRFMGARETEARPGKERGFLSCAQRVISTDSCPPSFTLSFPSTHPSFFSLQLIIPSILHFVLLSRFSLQLFPFL